MLQIFMLLSGCARTKHFLLHIRPTIQAHTRDPKGHSQVSSARGTPPSSHRYTASYKTKTQVGIISRSHINTVKHIKLLFAGKNNRVDI